MNRGLNSPLTKLQTFLLWLDYQEYSTCFYRNIPGIFVQLQHPTEIYCQDFNYHWQNFNGSYEYDKYSYVYCFFPSIKIWSWNTFFVFVRRSLSQTLKRVTWENCRINLRRWPVVHVPNWNYCMVLTGLQAIFLSKFLNEVKLPWFNYFPLSVGWLAFGQTKTKLTWENFYQCWWCCWA